ncbi:MAG: hypothetical protein CSA97_05885 [Bacteroidetes bacterium]|nr:MAG: hypothetical protein CSA97_05885 [Bacteroidota bacterium]
MRSNTGLSRLDTRCCFFFLQHYLLMEQIPKVDMEGYQSQRGPTDYEIMMSFFRGVGSFTTTALIHLYKRRWFIVGTAILAALSGYAWHSRSTLEYEMTISMHNTLVRPADVHSLIEGIASDLDEQQGGLAYDIIGLRHEPVSDTVAYGSEAKDYAIIKLFTKTKRDGAEYTQWLEKRVASDPFLQQKMERVKKTSQRTIADNDKLITVTEELLRKSEGASVFAEGRDGGMRTTQKPASDAYLSTLMKLRRENLELETLLENKEAFHILSPFGEPKRAHSLAFRVGMAWVFWLLVLAFFDVLVWTKRQALKREKGRSA